MSIHDRPTAAELIEAVREYLSQEVAQTADQRARFRALIAANVLAIVQREIESGAGSSLSREDLARLCAAIRSGEYDDPERFARVLADTRALVERKLAVSNPRYLKRSKEPEKVPKS